MTFEELDQKLPNGFHDSKIRNLKLNFVDGSTSIGMDLLIGLPDTLQTEGYRAGTLTITSTYLFFIEPPDPRYNFIPDGSPISVSGSSVKVGQNAMIDQLLSALPPNATVYVFFLDDWNSCLYLAGRSIEFIWDDGGGWPTPN